MQNDAINPAHYGGAGLSPIEYMEMNNLSEAFCLGNVIKYTMRARAKNGAEDYKKAIWYLHYLVARANGLQGSDLIAYAKRMTQKGA